MGTNLTIIVGKGPTLKAYTLSTLCGDKISFQDIISVYYVTSGVTGSYKSARNLKFDGVSNLRDSIFA